eukprot:282020_1
MHHPKHLLRNYAILHKIQIDLLRHTQYKIHPSIHPPTISHRVLFNKTALSIHTHQIFNRQQDTMDTVVDALQTSGIARINYPTNNRAIPANNNDCNSNYFK